MTSFADIYAEAVARKGSEALLAASLPAVADVDRLSATRDDRCLAEMTRCIFQAGFVWRVIDNKWPGFETAFWGFDLERVLSADPEAQHALCEDPRIVRNPQKINTVFANARFIAQTSVEHGGFGRFLAQWPTHDLLGLHQHLKSQGARLGGMTGPRFLRSVGKDSYILTADVVQGLQRAGLSIKDQATSKADRRRIQHLFDAWHNETGRPYAHLSKIVACAVSGTMPLT